MAEIPIRNIYYMLSYAFKILQSQGYERIKTESFDNAAELYAEILIIGVGTLVKRGLGRDYASVTEATSMPRGKIDVSGSIKTLSFTDMKLVCAYDEFSVDTLLNRILKTSMLLLIRSDIDKSRKRRLRKLLAYFEGVGTLDLRFCDWRPRYDRNNETYRVLIAICKMIYENSLQSRRDAGTRVMNFNDDNMSRLYEKFLLAYYRKHFRQLTVAPLQIDWALDGDGDTELLPKMRSDITITNGQKTLIIDAKYYTSATNSRVFTGKNGETIENKTLWSHNLYQIFTYVKNMTATSKGDVSGLLLYAKTNETIQPNASYRMSGNDIAVRSIDLNCEFIEIREQLDSIVVDRFRVAPSD